MTATLEITPNATAQTEPAPRSGELLILDPASLLLDGNVRGAVHLDKDFLASIREQGVLVPIVAVRTSDGSHRVRYGQRRTLAALETGRGAVPVYVAGDEATTDEGTIERIVTQVHENELRAGLSAADKTAAVEQLALLGLSAAQMVKAKVASRADVDAALAVAGSKLAKRSTERYDFLTLDMAATVAEFDSKPETVKALIAAAKQGEGQFAHVAQRARDDRDRARARADVEKKLTEAGVRIIDAPGYGDKTIKQLSELVDVDGKVITPAGHKTCSGHAGYVGHKGYWSDGEVTGIYVCTDWKANGHRDRYRTDQVPAAQMSEADRENARAARREVIDNNKAWVSAETVRRAWLKTFLTRKSAPKGGAVFVAVELAHGAHELGQALDYSGNTLLHELVGVKDKSALAVAASAATEARAQVLAVAWVLAAYEAQTSKQTWRRKDAAIGRYFAFLAAQGYELSDVEKLCLTKAERKAAPRRRQAASLSPAEGAASEAPAADESPE